MWPETSWGQLRAWLCFFALATSAWASVGAASNVDLVSVRFNDRRLAGQSYPWYETELTLRSKTATPVEGVSVQVYLKYKTPQGDFSYSGSVRLYALDKTARVRFYLPPDAVRAHNLPRTPEYLVELASNAGSEPYSRDHSSVTLSTPVLRESLKKSATIPLLNHTNTPFYNLAETQRELPSYEVR